MAPDRIQPGQVLVKAMAAPPGERQALAHRAYHTNRDSKAKPDAPARIF
jgi:hypothetical protein